MGARDTIVVGGGIIGLAIATELADRGVSVTLCEAGSLGRESSWAAAGMIAPSGEQTEGSLRDIAAHSAEIYPEWLESLAFRQPPVPISRAGTLLLARDEAEATELQRNRDGRWLDGGTLATLEPAAGHLPGARLVEDWAIDNRRLVDALVRAAYARGVRVLAQCPVVGLWMEEGQLAGVRLTAGTIPGRQVIYAAGAWTGALASELVLPVRPVRGQCITVNPPATGSWKYVMRWADGYAVPRGDTLIIGATEEDAGFDNRVTRAGIASTYFSASRILPVLAGAKVQRAWSGLRPGTPDRRPIIGQTTVPGLIVATGHFRNGILLAPVTAEIVGDLATRGATDFDLSAFDPRRFETSAESVEATL